MKVRSLLECTIDITNPAVELSATISAVLASLPTPEHRLEVLEKLDSEIGKSLADYHAKVTEITTEAIK